MKEISIILLCLSAFANADTATELYRYAGQYKFDKEPINVEIKNNQDVPSIANVLHEQNGNGKVKENEKTK